jgi:hypothetical protein
MWHNRVEIGTVFKCYLNTNRLTNSVVPEAEGSSLCSQESTTSSYPDPIEEKYVSVVEVFNSGDYRPLLLKHQEL